MNKSLKELSELTLNKIQVIFLQIERMSMFKFMLMYLIKFNVYTLSLCHKISSKTFSMH